MASAQVAARIAVQVAAVRAEIAAACTAAGRDPASVRLIAVTKSQGPEVLAPLAAAGITDVAENRYEHQEEMRAAATAAGLDLTFHAIGRIQGRQLAKLVPLSECLHSLCELDHVARLVRVCAGGRSTPFPVFLQVNTSGEAAKAGIAPAELPALLATVRAAPELDAVGLMTMAPEGADESLIRSTFTTLRDLAAQHGLPRLSMGMSQDFPLAIAAGATDVRIGTRLFV